MYSQNFYSNNNAEHSYSTQQQLHELEINSIIGTTIFAQMTAKYPSDNGT